jgi:DUF1126 PH-like domain
MNPLHSGWTILGSERFNSGPNSLQTLRWYGYYTEDVPDSQTETFRVRRLVVLYYPEDDTLQVTEPKQDNSGLPQVF